MGTIKKPDANPVAALLISWLLVGLGHIIINGQTNKWIYITIATVIGLIMCVVPGIIVAILSMVDSYQTAVRLQKGEAIGENEYTNPMLYKICKILDKKATCKNA